MTAIKEMKKKYPYNVLVDAGDVFSGTLYFNKYLGQADLEFMNLVGYDAMTFGNHEFDKDTETLAAFIKNMKFPMVSANVNVTKDPALSPLFQNKYATTTKDGEMYKGIVKTINGEKVGIFGLTTEDTKNIAMGIGSVTFDNYINAAKEAVANFEEQGVNKIIALTHLGYDDGDMDSDVSLANHVEGIDIIVGGHDHKKIEAPVKVSKFTEPTIIVQANEYSKYLGTLNVGFDKNGKVVSHEGALIELDAKDEAGKYVIPDDMEALDILETKYKPAVEELKAQVVGSSTVDLLGGNPAARTAETNLGNFIADGMLAKAKTINSKTSIAIQNGGGVRTTLNAGDITTADILKVLPFGNTLGIMELTGNEILETLEHAVAKAPEANGAFLQISGMKYTYDSSKNKGERVVAVQVEKEGEFVDLVPTEKYVVATNMFTATGGDGFEALKKASDEGRVSNPGNVDWEIFKEHLEAQPNKTISPKVEGRIVDIAKNN